MRKARLVCAECPALAKGLCSSLNADELARLGAVSWHRRFQSGKAIHEEGEIPPAFGAVLSGVVKLMKSMPDGTQQIVGLAGAGDFLGRPFTGEARAAAVAASEVEVCWFPRAAIEALATESGAVKTWLYEYVAGELEKAQEWIVLLGRMTAEQKVAAFLLSVLRNKRFEKDGDSELPAEDDVTLDLPLSRTEMADYLGLTIETVSRHIARLRERGILTVGSGRTVTVHDTGALLDMVGSALTTLRAKEALRA